ncbi:P-type conjugative transfer protein TrbG [Shinella yambaruensis]|uniref:Conjugal transfer protein TrbG n=1 Tax=Shinella yambaruensis TaxID=415996 RepID=A0ABQ5ZTW2_9HYPH|nr:P-type conjugative transfer protein TrbG [Shinella yambaruensis]MCJ8029973.1 P-type conjugative transfer protein TrbG [Shinella yambaruensis]MCU7984229.1 P-type conjugative transfer protein TrbG [Shinella yambaruensis]GLR55172.1 conjugal transfer protein TrbG [Shinella yambaruensis]
MKLRKSVTATGFLAAAILLPPSAAYAQQVPALEANRLPTEALISPNEIWLDGKEAHGINLANEWKTNPDKPRKGADGSVKYLFGATLPTLVCTPLEICAVRLQPGEIVNDVHAGDTARWRITPATSGTGATSTTHVVVKPTDAGLTTSLFISTDRRTYTIKLASTQKEWIPLLSFDYPDDVQREWAAYRDAQQNFTNATTLPSGQSLLNLNFDFRISGDRPSWVPQRVYTDGSKTYIQFPNANLPEAPALVALGKGGVFKAPPTEMINYRVIGDRYIIDQVVDRVALITGVGRQQTRVIIERGR